MDVSISIVSYNTKSLTKRCLSSIYKNIKNLRYEIIVVDNGSTDETTDMIRKEFPKVILIANKTNRFFTTANNQAFEKAKGKYCLILNSDTYFVDNSIKKMIDYLESNQSVGACEGLEVYEDGKIVPTGSLNSSILTDFYELSFIGTKIANKKLISKFRMSDKDRKDTYDIDVGCDAFFMVRSDLFSKIGKYDEKLLLYYTENDLCFRIKKQGFRVVHLGEAKIVHRVSATAKTLGSLKSEIYYKDMKSYYTKYGSRVKANFLYLILVLEKFILKTLKHDI